MTDASSLVRRLANAGQTVAAAESVTGGMFLAALTGTPGASQVVRGGMVTYATDTKTSLAGVPELLLSEVGPVDPAVARAMAEGVRDRVRATFGVSITGVAGPDEQAGRPVGEVHVAVAGPLGVVTATRDFGPLHRRDAIRAAACEAAIDLLDAVSRESAT